MYKRWRVYSTFLTGLFIGLFYALLIGNPWSLEPSDSAGLIEWRVLVLAFSGILGGVLYAIVVNGEIEMPRFVVDRDGVFKAGLFGDILLGIAGAFILELMLPSSLSVIDPSNSEIVADAVSSTGIEGSAIAATGIVGGYGGRAVIKFSLERFFKYTGTLDEFRANEIIQRRAQRISQQASARSAPTPSLAIETVDVSEDLSEHVDEQTVALIEQIDRYVQVGAPKSDRAELILRLRSEPDSVRQTVFSALVELREEIADELGHEQLLRMADLLESLITASPNEHPLYYQLAVVRTEQTPPAYVEALAAVNKAIALRGPLAVGKAWQYELHRAVINIEQAQIATEDFTVSAAAQEVIVADLETIAHVYNPKVILQAADNQQIPQSVVDWIRHNSAVIEDREPLRSLLPSVRSVMVGSASWPIVASAMADGRYSDSVHSEVSQRRPLSDTEFPEIFSALGRCYDILSLDPFNILSDESAKATSVFDFRESYPQMDEGETVLVPEGVRYIPRSSGKMEVSSHSELLYTESDIQRMFSSTLGGVVSSVLGAVLPFSLSASYASYKRDRKLNHSVYAFTKAEYVHYSLLLESQQSSDALPLNETFRQAVAQLPTTSTYEYLNFIDDFGTHTATRVEFGGLFHHRYCLDKSSYESMVKADCDVSVEAKRAFEAKYGRKRQSSELQSFSYSSEVYDFCGGTKKENIHDWFPTIKEDPAPIHLDLKPLYELLDSRLFPEDKQIMEKRSLLEIATQTYLEKNSEAIDWEIWPSAAVGSTSGEQFSDIKISSMTLETNEDRYKHARVKAVNVWIKDWVEGVQIVLEGDQPPFQVHGSQEGDLKTLDLGPHDYITAVSVRAPSARKILGGREIYIGSIKIQTYKQRTWTVGKFNSNAIALDIPKDYQVIGFHGWKDNRIEKLGVISIPVAHTDKV